MNERDEFLCNRIDNLAAIIEHLGKLREREKDQFLRNVLARYTITLDEYKKQLLTDPRIFASGRQQLLRTESEDLWVIGKSVCLNWGKYQDLWLINSIKN